VILILFAKTKRKKGEKVADDRSVMWCGKKKGVQVNGENEGD
jgi:hypothetical protein